MAPVNTEYDGDRERILSAAQRCFVRNGMHGTSMEDVAREAGLPEETINVHFKDRDELVAGIAGQVLRLMSGFFAEIRGEETVPPLDEVIERFADTVITVSKGPGHLVPIYWASALYNEPMAERARALIQAGRAGWVEIAERELAAGNLAPDADPQAVGSTLVSLLPGILLQRVLFDDIDAEIFRSGIRSLLGASAQ